MRDSESDLAARDRQQQIIADLGSRALGDRNLQDFIDQCLAAVERTLDVDLAALFEPVPGRPEVTLRAGAGWSDEEIGSASPLEHCVDLLQNEAGAVIQAMLLNPDSCRPTLLAGRGMTSALVVAIGSADGPVGVLAAYAKQPRLFTTNDRHVLQALANVVANALMRSSAEEDLQKSQVRLQSVQKMEAIGRLAGGIAHDFNNLVQAIGGYSEILLKRLADDDPLRRNAEEIKRAGDRAAALTQQLLAFSRQQVLHPKVIDLNTIVANMEQLLRRLIGEHIELNAKLMADLWRTKADVVQIEQVLMNLAVNARDAMPEGGTLTVETSNTELPQPHQREAFPVVQGHYVLLVVSDSGCGMTPEVRARAFEPFFTTKELGKGTGLGLSTVYGIVKQSGGYIWVDSEVGTGTRVRICLPRATEIDVPFEAPVRAPQASVTKGSETLLLVEDEEGVRELMREWLTDHGYHVLVASNGTEALALCEQYHDRIDVMVADVVMPQMGGPALAKRLLPLRPDMKVIYVSGYADDGLGDHRMLEATSAFLQKPFTLESLVRKLREILDVPLPTP